MRVHGVELLGLVLRDFEHLHGDDTKAVLLELLNNVADGIALYCVGLNDGKCALKSFHNSSFVFDRFVPARPLVFPWRPSQRFFALKRRSPQGARRSKCDYFPSKAAATVSPISAGVGQTRIPAACIALIFSDAVPCPPEMIAPAWPMRRPGGAVCPAIHAMTGLCMRVLTNSAAVSSAAPVVSPIIATAFVRESGL